MTLIMRMGYQTFLKFAKYYSINYTQTSLLTKITNLYHVETIGIYSVCLWTHLLVNSVSTFDIVTKI